MRVTKGEWVPPLSEYGGPIRIETRDLGIDHQELDAKNTKMPVLAFLRCPGGLGKCPFTTLLKIGSSIPWICGREEVKACSGWVIL